MEEFFFWLPKSVTFHIIIATTEREEFSIFVGEVAAVGEDSTIAKG